MAFKATLDLEGTPFIVESCNFSLHQDTDPRYGKPTAQVSPGVLSMVLRVDGKKLKELWMWGKENSVFKDGGIKFFKIDEDASLFELKFTEGYCTSFAYSMSAHGGTDMTVSIDVSYRILELEGEGFDLDWHGTEVAV